MSAERVRGRGAGELAVKFQIALNVFKVHEVGNEAAQQALVEALHQEQKHDVLVEGAEALHGAYLTVPLVDRYQHGVGDPHDGHH